MTAKRKVSEWLAVFSEPDTDVRAQFASIYGQDPTLLRERIAWYGDVVRRFCQVYGQDQQVIIVRAPGRINLVGMHIDQRGGAVNPIACRDVVMVVEPREDDLVVLGNVDERFLAALPRDRRSRLYATTAIQPEAILLRVPRSEVPHGQTQRCA